MIPPMQMVLMAVGGRTGQLNNPGTQTYSDTTSGSPFSSKSGIRIASDRDVDERRDDAYFDQNDWLIGGDVGDFEARLTYSGTALDAGSDATSPTFVSCDTDPEWWITRTGVGGPDTGSGTVRIRRKSDTSDFIEFSVSFSVQVFA